MAKRNPNTPMRVALIQALAGVTWSGQTVPVWAKRVPKGTAVPRQYIIIESQSKQPTEVSKECWDWETTTTIRIFGLSPTGIASPVRLDTIEEQVTEAVLGNLNIAGFGIGDEALEDSLDDDYDTGIESVETRIIRIRHWLWEL